MIAAPRHQRTSHQAVKKPGIKLIENLFQVVMGAFGAEQAFASAHLANEVGLGGNALAAREFAKPGCVLSIDLFAVELGNQDVKDGMQHGLRRSLQQVRDSHQNAPVAQPDGVVEIGEGKKLNLEFRQGSARTQLTICQLKQDVRFRVQEFQISTRER